MTNTDDSLILWYFADPMCSWCWGFSPVITQIKKEFEGRFRIALNLGGLRPGTAKPLSKSMREEILHHWQEVNRLTGQHFKFEEALPEGFIYDTEPASRAVLAFGKLNPKATLDYFSAIQKVFYTEGKDVTQADVLAELTVPFAVDKNEFMVLFQSDKLKQDTRSHFIQTRQAGVTGFPTVIWQDGDMAEVLCVGYRPYDVIAEKIKEKLSNHTGT
ncbi:MAG: DsbA family protein [Gammaproteobacteria bacterium]|nr:DsbA family protein [Gammaproteobacteria bacterium]